MPLLNDHNRYGLLSKLMHWISAIIVVSMFSLGYWMDTLDYTSSWYKTAPDIHRSIGVLFLVFTVLRLTLKITMKKPGDIATHQWWEKKLSKVVHGLFYAVIFILFVSGYLITTSTGQSLYVFDWFSLPSIITSENNLEDLAGDIHYYAAYGIIAMAFIHALGALKHHFKDRDVTLRRMWFGSKGAL